MSVQRKDKTILGKKAVQRKRMFFEHKQEIRGSLLKNLGKEFGSKARVSDETEKRPGTLARALGTIQQIVFL